MSEKPLSDLPEWMQELIPRVSREFDELCVEVHQAEDDPEEWLSNDTPSQTLRDLASAANNLRYTYMRIRLLQERLKREQGEEVATEDFRKDGQ